MTKTWEELRDAAASECGTQMFDRNTLLANMVTQVFSDGADFGREQGILEMQKEITNVMRQWQKASIETGKEIAALKSALEAERARSRGLVEAVENWLHPGPEEEIGFGIPAIEQALEAYSKGEKGEG